MGKQSTPPANIRRGVSTKSVLSQDGFWQVNKKLSHQYGDPLPALLLSFLIDREEYHRTNKELTTRDGKQWFYATSETIQDKTCIGYRPQKRLIGILEEHEHIKTQLMGRPARLHFHINHGRILDDLLRVELSAYPSFSGLAKLEPVNGPEFEQSAKTCFAEPLKLVLPKRQNSYKEYSNKEFSNELDSDAVAKKSPQPSSDPDDGKVEKKAATGKSDEEKKKKNSGAKKKKLGGLVIDPAYKKCVDTFHDRHKEYHTKNAADPSVGYIGITWTKKERGCINRIAKAVRGLTAKKKDIKAAEVSVDDITAGLRAILLRMEGFSDNFIATKLYTPSGVLSQWNNIINRIQTERQDATTNGKRAGGGPAKRRNSGNIIDKEKLLASLNTPRYQSGSQA